MNQTSTDKIACRLMYEGFLDPTDYIDRQTSNPDWLTWIEIRLLAVKAWVSHVL